MNNAMKFGPIVFVVSIALGGCFTKTIKTEERRPPYEPVEGSLSSDYFHSPTGDIAGRFPKDWLRVNVEQVQELESVSLIYTNPSRTSALVLMEIPGTAELRRNVERDGLIALTDASFAAKRAKLSASKPSAGDTAIVITRPPELYPMQGRLVASYNYSDTPSLTAGRKEHRVVVFTTGVRFYELAMIELVPPSMESQHLENFRLLESVIGHLEGSAGIAP